MISPSGGIPEFPLNIEKGASFDHTFQWFGGGKRVAPIEYLIPGYPTTFQITAHGLNGVSPTPVIISGVRAYNEYENERQMRNINSEDTGIDLATRVDDNTFTMNVSTVGDLWVPGTGEATYWLHTDITGYGGECNIRKNWHSPVAHVISTALGTMTLDGADGSIRLQIASNVTNTIDLVNGIFDVDLWPGGGPRPTDGSTIVRVFKGPVKFHKDS
jgi:hypothetical protein